MAYNFNGTSQYISASSSPAASHPITFAAQMKSSSFAANGNTAISVSTTATSAAFYILYAYQQVASDPKYEVFVSPGSRAATVTDAGFSTNVWVKAVGVFASATSRSIYVDAPTFSATTTQADTAGTADNLRIGVYTLNNSTTSYFAGDLAELAIWSAALTADEAASLGKGFKPYRIRPQSLVFYAPAIRSLQDRKGLALTNNNSATVANHPRVI